MFTSFLKTKTKKYSEVYSRQNVKFRHHYVYTQLSAARNIHAQMGVVHGHTVLKIHSKIKQNTLHKEFEGTWTRLASIFFFNPDVLWTLSIIQLITLTSTSNRSQIRISSSRLEGVVWSFLHKVTTYLYTVIISEQER